jgi:hypothetical protein
MKAAARGLNLLLLLEERHPPSSPIQGASMFGEQILEIISHLALVCTIVSGRI